MGKGVIYKVRDKWNVNEEVIYCLYLNRLKEE